MGKRVKWALVIIGALFVLIYGGIWYAGYSAESECQAAELRYTLADRRFKITGSRVDFDASVEAAQALWRACGTERANAFIAR